MIWETPSFVEIGMSAEIGGYQGDDDNRDDCAPRGRDSFRAMARYGHRREVIDFPAGGQHT
jgi:hypothetical protein